MNFKEENQSLIETISIVLLTTLALFLSLRVFPLAIFLFPISFIVLGVKHGIKYNIIGLILSVIAIGFFTDFLSAIIILVLFLPFTIALIYTIGRDEKPGKVMLLGTLAFFISILILVLVVTTIYDFNFIEEYGKIFKNIFDQRMEIFRESGLGQAEIKNMEDAYDILYENFTMTTPSMFLLFSMGLTYINYLISSFIIRKEREDIKNRPIFSEFKLPKNIFFGTVIMLVISYILMKKNILNGISVYSNIILIFNFIFTLQGLAVIDFKLKEKGLNKIIRIIINIFSLLLSTVMGNILSFVGILDSLFDFRRQSSKEK